MSKRTRALVLGVTLAAMNLAGLTAAQAHPNDDPTSNRHRALGQLGLLTAEHVVASQEQPTDDAVEQFRSGERAAQEQTAADAALQRQLARDRHSIPSGTSAKVPAPAPSEPNGQSGWLVLTLGVLSAALALVAGLAVLAARRASRRMRLGHAA
jgi:hypothetical protein